MTKSEVFMESVIEGLRTLQCELEAKAERASERGDRSNDRGDFQEHSAMAYVYRECAVAISNRSSKFARLYERLYAKAERESYTERMLVSSTARNIKLQTRITALEEAARRVCDEPGTRTVGNSIPVEELRTLINSE